MISRRELIKYSAGAGLTALSGGRAWAEVVAPKRAVFLFIPMGGLSGAWTPSRCKTLQDSGDMLAPFAPVANRCIVPEAPTLEVAGFGQPYYQLTSSPFEIGADSLDTLIANRWGSASAGNHLRLCATESNSFVTNSGVSIASGNILPLSAYLQTPDQLLNQLEAYGVAGGQLDNGLSEFDETVDSLSTWRIKNFFDLIKVSLQSGFSDTVTFMIGNDSADVMAPPELGLPTVDTLRMYAPTGRTQEFIKFKAYLHGLVANFINNLAQTNDADGQPLLDSTMVYLFSNMGDGDSYAPFGAPVLLAGADATFRTGSVVNGFQGTRPILNAISYAYFGKRGLIFGDDIALNMLRF